MTAQHTPGNWEERIDNPIFNENPIPMPEYVIYGQSGERLIASVWTKTKLGDKEAQANARLIAAAPKLLTACKELCNWIVLNIDGVPQCASRAGDIIRKARGE